MALFGAEFEVQNKVGLRSSAFMLDYGDLESGPFLIVFLGGASVVVYRHGFLYSGASRVFGRSQGGKVKTAHFYTMLPV